MCGLRHSVPACFVGDGVAGAGVDVDGAEAVSWDGELAIVIDYLYVGKDVVG